MGSSFWLHAMRGKSAPYRDGSPFPPLLHDVLGRLPGASLGIMPAPAGIRKPYPVHRQTVPTNALAWAKLTASPSQ